MIIRHNDTWQMSIRLEACTQKNKIYEECVRSLTCPSLLPPRNFICVRLVIVYLFPKYYTQRDAHSEHHTLKILRLVGLRSSFNPWSHFVVLTKQNINLLSAKFQEWANPLIHAVSLLFRVSGRWVRPWFPTVIGPFHDELIQLLLLLPESLRLLLSWTNEGLIFQTSHNLRSGPQKQKEKKDRLIAG